MTSVACSAAARSKPRRPWARVRRCTRASRCRSTALWVVATGIIRSHRPRRAGLDPGLAPRCYLMVQVELPIPRERVRRVGDHAGPGSSVFSHGVRHNVYLILRPEAAALVWLPGVSPDHRLLPFSSLGFVLVCDTPASRDTCAACSK